VFISAPTPLAGLTLLAQIRDAEFNLVATVKPILTSSSAFAALAALNPQLVAGGAQALIYVPNTTAWPEGLLRMDVLAQIPGGPQSLSQTVGIEVRRSVTELSPEQADYNPVTAQ
jgi:hypothetical protein